MKTKIIQTDPLPSTSVGAHGWVRKHRLVTFFPLAFVLAWWSWPLAQFDIWPRQEFHAIGALLAAIVVIALADGKAGFIDLGKRMIRWRVLKRQSRSSESRGFVRRMCAPIGQAKPS